MDRVIPCRPWGVLGILTALIAAPAARSDAISVVQMLRAGGCGGIAPIAPPLRHNLSLDRLAEQWANGHRLGGARSARARLR